MKDVLLVLLAFIIGGLIALQWSLLYLFGLIGWYTLPTPNLAAQIVSIETVNWNGVWVRTSSGTLYHLQLESSPRANEIVCPQGNSICWVEAAKPDPGLDFDEEPCDAPRPLLRRVVAFQSTCTPYGLGGYIRNAVALTGLGTLVTRQTVITGEWEAFIIILQTLAGAVLAVMGTILGLTIRGLLRRDRRRRQASNLQLSGGKS